MSALKKIFLILTFFLFLGIVFPAQAATPLTSANFNDTINTGVFYDNQLRTLYSMFYGADPYGGQTFSHQVTYVMQNGQLTMVTKPVLTDGNTNQGALAMLGKTVASLYTPPTSSAEYLANLGENIGISTPKAYAQVTGSGANVISPVLKLWQVTRNLAYIAFILVFMTAGLMIMFRQRLNPQTVIGMQQALPGLVIGLILITFSYFIAALIVDLSFVGTRVVVEVFKNASMPNLYDDLDQTYNNSDAFQMYAKAGGGNLLSNVGDVFGSVWGTIGPDLSRIRVPSTTDQIANFIGGIFGPLGMIVGCIFGAGSTCQAYQAAGAVVVSTLAAILVPVILAIALMIQFIRLIINLLLSYIQILVMVIAGPIFLMISAIPGRGGLVGFWLKTLLANSLVFPAVFAGFLFAGMLLKYEFNPTGQMPMFGGIGTQIIRALLAFAVLLALPKLPDMVRDAMGVKMPQGITQAAAAGFMGGFAATRGGYNTAMERTGVRSEQQARQKQEIERRQANYAVGAPAPTTFLGRAQRTAARFLP